MRRNKIERYWLRGLVYKPVFGGPRTDWSAQNVRSPRTNQNLLVSSRNTSRQDIKYSLDVLENVKETIKKFCIDMMWPKFTPMFLASIEGEAPPLKQTLAEKFRGKGHFFLMGAFLSQDPYFCCAIHTSRIWCMDAITPHFLL